MINTDKLYEKFEQMRDELGAEVLADELYSAMTTDEAESILRYIATNWDMEIFKD